MDKRSGSGAIGSNMILGVDYGLRNIGLAISEGELAEPWGTVAEINEIKNVVVKLGVTLIVVGISEGKSKDRALGFGRKLGTMLRLPVEYADETLSTHEAGGKNHAKAAAVILQRFLDERRSNV